MIGQLDRDSTCLILELAQIYSITHFSPLRYVFGTNYLWISDTRHLWQYLNQNYLDTMVSQRSALCGISLVIDYASVLHTRLRLGSSQLNSHLFKIGVKRDPSCQCGEKREDAWHFFFCCPLYTTARSQLHNIISKYAPFSLQTVLYGSKDCTLLENIQIFSAVEDFIIMSNRFSQTGIG